MDAETDDTNGQPGEKGRTANAAGGSLPDKRMPEHGSGSLNKNLCPIGILAFVLLLIAGLWLLVGGKRNDPLLKLIPATADRAEVYNCSPDLREKIADLPLWKNEKAAADALAGGIMRLEFAPVAQREEWKKIYPFVSRVARIFTPQGELFVIESVKGSSGNGWDVWGTICKEIAKDYVKDRDTVKICGDIPVQKLNLPGVGSIHIMRDGNYVALTRSLPLLEQVVACKRGEAHSLAGLEGVAGAESTKSALLVRYVVPSRTNLLFPGVREAEFNPEAAVLSVVRPAADGLLMASTVVLNTAHPEQTGHGFFYYVGMTILIILCVTIGFPALFLLVTILLAGYFHLAAWWRGEVVPLEPHELPELSKEMKEDLGGKESPAQQQGDAKDPAPGE